MTSAIMVCHVILLFTIFHTTSAASLPTTKPPRRFPSFPQLYRPENVDRQEKLVMLVSKNNGSRLEFPSFPQFWTPEDTAAAAADSRSVNKRSVFGGEETDIAKDTPPVNVSGEAVDNDVEKALVGTKPESDTIQGDANGELPEPVFAEAEFATPSEEDVCDSNPCLHEGLCLSTTTAEYGPVYACACSVRYEGDHCEKDLGACLADPCHNGGTCEVKGNTFQCTCKPGYFGSHCHVHISSCDSFPCMNGGTCHDERDIAEFLCVCTPFFFGRQCEMEMSAGTFDSGDGSVFAEASFASGDGGSDSDDGEIIIDDSEGGDQVTVIDGPDDHDDHDGHDDDDDDGDDTTTPSMAPRPVLWSGFWMLTLPVSISAWHFRG